MSGIKKQWLVDVHLADPFYDFYIKVEGDTVEVKNEVGKSILLIDGVPLVFHLVVSLDIS